jgi:hypothetical protein
MVPARRHFVRVRRGEVSHRRRFARSHTSQVPALDRSVAALQATFALRAREARAIRVSVSTRRATGPTQRRTVPIREPSVPSRQGWPPAELRMLTVQKFYYW